MNTKRKLGLEAWSHVLVYLYNHQGEKKVTAFKMCAELGFTTCSISNNVVLLKNKKLIIVTRKGRVNEYALTSKGAKLAVLLRDVLEELKHT